MSNIFDEVKNKEKYNPNNSVAWFRKNVTDSFKAMGTGQFLGRHQALQKMDIAPGQLVFFGYDPKFKDKLPYYDNFPMILPFAADDKHFTGINLHYMPPMMRINILDKLLHFAENKNIPSKMKLELSWKMLNSLSEHNAIKHSVKKYLRGYVKTRFVVVPMEDWPIAVFLPLARFRKASETEVWRGAR